MAITTIPKGIVPISVDGNTIGEVITTDPNSTDAGMVVRDVRGNPTNPTFISSDVFVQTDFDNAGSPTYTGYVNSAGNWYIKKDSTAAQRYVSGTTGYPTNWTNRASLTYVYYYQL